MNTNYNEQIKKNYDTIIELEKQIRNLYAQKIDNSQFIIDYNSNQQDILKKQNNYISYLNTLIDILYQNKINEKEEEINNIISGGKINKSFYQLYNMGRFFYNNQYYPLNSIYIKVLINQNNSDTVFQLISTEDDNFSFLSKEDVNISQYNFTNFFRFKDSSIFKNIYNDERICTDFDININSYDNLKILIEYLKAFDQKEYNFIEELEKKANE